MPKAIETLFKQNPMLAKGLIYQASAERSLYDFIKLMWEYLEPGREFREARHIRAMCEHLEAVSRGEIRKLLINIPPGFAKSIVVNVFWPAWEWIEKPHLRYLTFSYASSLTERDNGRFGTLVKSDLYRTLWGTSFEITKDNQVKLENSRTGWKIASSVGGTGTGERGNRLIIDDANNIKDVESKTTRDETNRWYMEVLPSRVIDPNESVFVNIQQRSNEDDVSGLILSRDMGYEHLCLPMEYDSGRKCITSIGWEDWREEDGELLWPEVYNQIAVDKLKSDKEMSSYAYAGQYMQSPAPRGGGIIKSSWWKMWPKQGEAFDESGNPLRALEYPVMDFIIASVDPAFTEKRANDYSACVVLGLYRDDGQPRIILMDAWQKRMSFHGAVPERRKGESRRDYLDREEWGLVELVAYTAHEMHADKVIVEKTASGIPLIQELIRLYSNEKFGVQGITPKGDKIARVHAVSNLFENGIIAAPDRWWAQLCIDEMSIFPRGKHDDLPDALTQGVKFLRDTGWALRTNEYEEETEIKEFRPREGAIYDV
jgi:predicted phage terminase large subunit-like protein